MKFTREYNSSSELILARLTGFHIGDGTATRHKDKTYPVVRFATKYYEDILRISNDLRNAGICELDKITRTRKTYKGKDTSVYLIVCSRDESKAFIDYTNIPIGRKIETDFCVPQWILEGDVRTQGEFLAGLYGAEGWLRYHTVQKIPQIGMKMQKHSKYSDSHILFFDQLQQLLAKFGIPTRRRVRRDPKNHGDFGIELSIHARGDVSAFVSQIGFRYSLAKEKKAFLTKQYLDAYQQEICKRDGIPVDSNVVKWKRITSFPRFEEWLVDIDAAESLAAR